MYPLDPPGVYVHDSVMNDDRCRRRMERVVAALARPIQPVVFSDDNLPEVMQREGWLNGCAAMGTLDEIRDPILVFNKFRFDDEYSSRLEQFKTQVPQMGDGHLVRNLLGDGAFNWANYNLEGDPNRKDKVCRPCWRIHFQYGCVHRCHYCGFGGLLVTMTNAEDYIHQLQRLMEANTWQETFLLEDDADILCLEPELGCLGPIIEFFGTTGNRYVILHTKSWNVDWMLDLKHNGNTIPVWSLCGPRQSMEIEPKTGTCEERIEAARKCQDAGYTVRYKFKPIIPIEGWREEASTTIEMALTRTKPDVISLCVFMWMEIHDLKRRLHQHTLDPAFVAAAEASIEETKDTVTKPFPEDVRAEIYDYYLTEIRKWNPDVPVSLSTETFSIWKRFQSKLGMNATNYVCGCGPNATPNRKCLTTHPFKSAVRGDEGIPGTW